MVYDVARAIITPIGAELDINRAGTELGPTQRGGEVQERMLSSTLAFKVGQTLKYEEQFGKKLNVAAIRISDHIVYENPLQDMYTGGGIFGGVSATRRGAETSMLTKTGAKEIVIIDEDESDFFTQLVKNNGKEGRGGI